MTSFPFGDPFGEDPAAEAKAETKPKLKKVKESTLDPKKWKVDIREPQEMIDRFPEGQRTTLDVGDYLYDDKVGFERKSKDFLDFKRVLASAGELTLAYPFAYLLVEGSLTGYVSMATKLFKRPMLMPILGMVSSLGVRGCPPFFCGNQEFLHIIMKKLAEKALDGKDRVEWRSIKVRPDISDEDITANMLVGLPGLGQKRAKALVAAFGPGKNTLETLVHNPERMLEVDGVGKGTLDMVKKRLGV